MESLSEDPSPLSYDDPSITQKIVGEWNASTEVRTLNFIMLGCEAKMPYGPLDHTAELLADLLSMAAAAAAASTTASSSNHVRGCCWVIRIKTYNAPEFEYPPDVASWDWCDGVLVPGSFAAAYNTDPWIERLKAVLQEEIVARRRPTLGICFGHQILAHSFHGHGRAVRTTSGPRAGRLAMPTTAAGAKLLHRNTAINLYYTHGDMVERLPDSAIALGGDELVPIQAAAYFGTSQEAANWCNASLDSTAAQSKPYAVTLQAHPEYATSLDRGVHRTLHQCMEAMERRGGICQDSREIAERDTVTNFSLVQQESVETMVAIGRLLGWFPE